MSHQEPIEFEPAIVMVTWGTSLCSVLGSTSMILNLFVIGALIRHRSRVLKNIFYVIVLHCAIVDVIRGACLIFSGLPFLFAAHVSLQNRAILFNANRHIWFILRACNLVTIFNLVVFTMNEFLVVRYPLHYKRYVRRRTTLFVMFTCWTISIFFGVSSGVSSPLSRQSEFFKNINISTVAQIIIFTLCYLCLFTVLICYAKILRTIREFHGFDNDKGRFCSGNGKRIFGSNQLKEQASMQHSQVTIMNSQDLNNRNDSGRRSKSHHLSRHKYLIVIGSVLFVDVLFLFPYSGIQLVSLLHREKLIMFSQSTSLIKWLLQILIGLHAVCQPLCYFRMTEFRRLACCVPKRSFRGSKSLSQHRSYANTRSRDMDDPEREALRGSEPRINLAMRAIRTGPRLSKSNESIAVKFRAHQLHAEREDHKQELSLSSSDLKAKSSYDSQSESLHLSTSPSELNRSRESTCPSNSAIC